MRRLTLLAGIWLGSVFAEPPAATTPLLDAILRDETETALALLGQGADPATANRYGITPLFVAASHGSAPLIQALLDAGANPNCDGETPLMQAARNGRPEAIEVLLTAGAKVDDRDQRGQTAIHWAAAEGHARAVQLLIDRGADPSRRLPNGFAPFFLAAREGHLEVTQVLLDAGIAPNTAMKDLKGGGRNPRRGTSALVLAIENGHFSLARHLIEAGADPNDDRTGYAPLHLLSWVRKPVRGDGIDGAPPPRGSGDLTSLAFARWLLENGAEVNLNLGKQATKGNRLGHEGATPFLLASRTADLPLMKLLLEKGADFRQPNDKGRTPLLAAVGVALGPEADEASSEDEALEAARYLIDLGAQIDVTDRDGETVMHAAAYKQAPRLVDLLAEAGADIETWNRNNRHGWTPLLISQGFRKGNFKPSAPTEAAIAKVMREAGVEPPIAPPRPGTKKEEKYQDR